MSVEPHIIAIFICLFPELTCEFPTKYNKDAVRCSITYFLNVVPLLCCSFNVVRASVYLSVCMFVCMSTFLSVSVGIEYRRF